MKRCSFFAWVKWLSCQVFQGKADARANAGADNIANEKEAAAKKNRTGFMLFGRVIGLYFTSAAAIWFRGATNEPQSALLTS